MSLIDRLRPKWKHSDPSIRAGAVRRLKDQALLETIIEDDPDESVRIAAVETLSDQAALAQIAKSRGGIAIAAVKQLTARALIESVALGADLPQVRALAVDRVEDALILHRIASTDPDALVRLRARARNSGADPARAFLKEMLSKLQIAEWKAGRVAEFCGTLDDVCHALIKDPRFFINGDLGEESDDAAVRLPDTTIAPWVQTRLSSNSRVARFLAQTRKATGDARNHPTTQAQNFGLFYQIKVWRLATDSYGGVAEEKRLAVTHDAVAWSRASNSDSGLGSRRARTP